MRKRNLIITLLGLLALYACMPANSLYTWGHFNIKAGYDFVKIADSMINLKRISIIDTRADGNEFRVNEQNIFLDTTQVDQPNYYNYIKRASEIGVDKNALLTALKTFYRMGVNEYRQKENYYTFPVVTSAFTRERGYLFTRAVEVSRDDTVLTKQGGLDYKLILVKQVETNWFEYVSDK